MHTKDFATETLQPAQNGHARDARGPSGGRGVKVISFNVKVDSRFGWRWKGRRERIAETLRRQEPDLAGLQEATHEMILDLQERLPEYRWVGVGRDDGKQSGEFTPIFLRADRWELQEHANFWLAAVCDLPGRGWDALCCRVVTWARLLHLESGQHCVHFNPHLDHLGKAARAKSAALLLQKMHEIAAGEPAILTGDFNCSDTAIPYRILTGAIPFGHLGPAYEPVRDTRAESASPPTGPGRTFRGLLRFLGIGRIDYIFVKNGLKTLRHAVLEEPGKASDHHPVIAELAFTGAAA
jgi:endonuclease/exonuclease/phosphatase family metal-dependent hydrolase